MGLRKNQKKQQKPIAAAKASHAQKQTFIEHVYELRSRLFWIVATLLTMSSLAFVFKDGLVSFILAPLNGEKLVYLTIGGGFSFIFTVCLYFGAVMAIPVIVYHLYRFLQPLLPKTTAKLTISVILVSAVLAISGAAFGYFVAIRASIDFLMGFAGPGITPNVTAESYLNFIIAYTAGLAFIFQLPLIMFLFDHIKPFPPGAMLSSQRFVITGAAIVAALITPTPDAVNMLIIAVPIVAIYEIGAVIIFMRRRSHHRTVNKPVSEQPKSPEVVRKTPVVQVVHEEIPIPVPLPQTLNSKAGRSIDGFKRPQQNTSLVVPKRPEPQVQNNRVLSIDGISVVRA
jgi:sec-independent protein translocase protein TatC